MKSIMLSIHPEWAKKIYSGEKKIEWRRTVPNICKRSFDVKCFVYETAPIKKVTGLFIIEAVCLFNKEDIIDVNQYMKGCISSEDLIKYCGEKKEIFAYVIKKPKRFLIKKQIDNYINSNTFKKIIRPPQSWCYCYYNNDELKLLKIPKITKGGIATSSTIANIGEESGAEAILPLPKLNYDDNIK